MISLVCGIQNRTHMNYRTDTDSQREQTRCQGKRGGEGKDWELQVDRCKLVHTGWMNRVPLQQKELQHRNFIMTNHDGREYEKKAYITESLCCTIDINVVNQLYHTGIFKK